MISEGIDIFTLVDTRVDEQSAAFYKGRVLLALGPESKCFVSPLVGGGSHRVGGQMTLATPVWGAKCYRYQSDKSGLGILSSTYVQGAAGTNLLLLGTYWPVHSPASKPDADRLWARLKKHLARTDTRVRNPLTHIHHIIANAAEAHQAAMAGPVYLLGDLNAVWQNPGTGRRHLATWAAEAGWTNPAQALTPKAATLVTYYAGLRPCSWIDHILTLRAAADLMTGFGIGDGTFWTTVSDHRPVLGVLRGAAVDLSAAGARGPRCNPLRPLSKPLGKCPGDQASFKAAMTKHLPDLVARLSTPLPSEAAGQLLLDISEASVRAVPRHPGRQQVRQRYKDGWSLRLLALKAQMEAVVAIDRRATPRNRYKTWRTDQERSAGIQSITAAWTARVDKLRWPDGKVDPEIWAVSPSPEELRTFTGTMKELSQLCRHAHTQLKGSLHGRKRREIRSTQTGRVHQMEELLAQGRLGKIIDYVTGTAQEPRFTPDDLRFPADPAAAGGSEALTAEALHARLRDHFKEWYQQAAGVEEEEPIPLGLWSHLLERPCYEAWCAKTLGTEREAQGHAVEALWRALQPPPGYLRVYNELRTLEETPRR